MLRSSVLAAQPRRDEPFWLPVGATRPPFRFARLSLSSFCRSADFCARPDSPPASAQRGPDDNALAETINGLYKAEVIHRRGPWRTFEAVEFATLEWVDWFNNRRLLEPIGFIPLAEAEERYFAMLNDPAMAA